ncbi:Dyp-type peroxidase [Embleya sp. NPDC005971]|uniref:Dyp-type peroxidase n=1 Tax=unclassified Embleya TaxID=2699296 RepID=UPI0033DD1159
MAVEHPLSRRGLLAAGTGAFVAGEPAGAAVPGRARTSGADAVIPFHGPTQAGILTRRQPYAVLASFDLRPTVDRAGVRELLRRWTDATARLTRGAPLDAGAATGAGIDADVLRGAGPAALTVTFAFGAGLFAGVGSPPPAELRAIPAFPGDELDPAHGDGDLVLQLAADDPIVVTAALRALRRSAAGAARERWRMRGFASPDSRRNLMGQIDGTANPDAVADVLVPAAGAPAWLVGGSYLVLRRIRMLLDHWETLPREHREQVIGRRLSDGAPLTGGTEHTPADFDAAGPGGAPAIAANAHVRLGAPRFNAGATMLRRGWSYDDGPRADGTPDAGLLFLAWQRDPHRAFVPVQQRLARGDALSRYTVHEASGLYVAPGGCLPGEYLGQALLEG